MCERLSCYGVYLNPYLQYTGELSQSVPQSEVDLCLVLANFMSIHIVQFTY